MAIPSTQNVFTIPTVDISSYLNDQTSSAAQDVVEQIRNACTTSGFFQITGHMVPQTLQAAVLSAATKLFNLPLEEKIKLTGPRSRGYEVIGSQALQRDTKPDLKESYYIGRDDPFAMPPYREFQYPNIWPSMQQIQTSEFKTPLLDYHERLTALSLVLMSILRRGLSHVDTSIFDHFCKDPVASIRLLHYPPQPKIEDRLQLGAGAHTDFGAVTLLLQDDKAGLQVLDQSSGDWINVPPDGDAYVVNVGDMLDKWTKGKYKSNVHRVINESGRDRYSVPFFFDGNLDCVLDPLDGSDGEGITVEEHMMERYAATVKT